MIDALANQQPASTKQQLPGKETSKPFYFGLKAGLNLANITGVDVSSGAKMLNRGAANYFICFYPVDFFATRSFVFIEMIYLGRGICL